MLDPKTGPGLFAGQPMAAEADEASTAEMIASVLGVVRRQLLLVLVLGIIGAVLGGVFLLKAQPRFTATATLLINTHKLELFQQPAVVTNELPMQAVGAVESQVELLRSDEVALRVIKKLNLTEDPRFADRLQPSALRRFLHRFFPGNAPGITSADDLQTLALRVFDDDLTVDRVGVTYAIEIMFRSTDPSLAAEIANAVADSYIELQRSSEYDAARRASDWLEERIPELRAKSEAAQKAVVEYKQEHNIVETITGQPIEDQRVADINVKLNAAKEDTLKARARADQFSDLKGSGFLGATASGANGPNAPADLLDKLRTQYIEVSSKLAESSGHLGANNPAIVSLRNQEAQLRSEITEEIQRLKQASEGDYAVAQLHEANLKKDFDVAVAQSHGAKEAQVRLRELEASAHAYQDLYTTYVSRYNASLQQAAQPIAEATIITPATPLIQRDYKKTIQQALLFPVAAFMLGLGLALTREMLADRVFLTSKSIQSRLRLGCIGVLPKIHSGKRMGWRSRKAPPAGAGPRTVVHGDRGMAWTVVERPFSQFSEGVRSVKFAIELENRSRQSGVVGITSALAHEGKSTVALALAQMIAANGASVILVDCDLRNPSLTRSIAPKAIGGIAEVALRKAPLEQMVWKDPTTGLAFLPAVPNPGPPDPPTLLSSAEMRHFFEKLREKYQYIIVDLSPLVPVIDVCATIDFVDAFVLVIEWGRTTVDIVKRALRAVPAVSDSMIGAVLNKADVKSLTSYDPYATGYYLDNGDR